MATKRQLRADLAEALTTTQALDELTSSTLPQASPDTGGSAAPPGSSP